MDMILKTTDLCKISRANGGKQCVTEHPAQLGLWSAGAEWGWQIHDLKNAHRHFAPHIGEASSLTATRGSGMIWSISVL